jgi:hypothetical protein
MRAKVNLFFGVILMELYAAWEFILFTKRHRRYFSTATLLYLYSFKSLRRAHFLRIGFAVLQHLDDVLDGDRKIDENALHYLERMTNTKPGSEKEARGHYRMRQLISYFFSILDRCTTPKHHPNEDFLLLMEALKFDYLRRENKLILPAAELIAHHHQTFYHSVNILLALAGSSKSANEERELVEALCWCSPMRDIKDDYSIGLINVPSEIIKESEQRGKDIFSSEAFNQWKMREFSQVQKTFDRYRTKEGKDPLAKYFMKALKMYADKYESLQD